MSKGYIIRGGRVIDPASGRDEKTDLCIIDDLISNPENADQTALTSIDANGLVISPGLIDIHVHLREPGNEDAENIESGSKAAAHGGFTSIVAMPNTTPPIDNAKRILAATSKARRIGLLNIMPSGCITIGRKGRALADLASMAKAGAVAFTDDGSCIPDSNLMHEAMTLCKELNITIMDHSLDWIIADNGCIRSGPTADRLGLKGIPASAETSIVERNIKLARETGCRIHIQHISCADSVRMIRKAREDNLPVSGEATPHHIVFTDEEIRSIDQTEFKMNPPLGTQEDREEILHGIADNTLTSFATDHAPHTAESKNKGFAEAPFGVIGLETALAATYTHCVKSGLMPITDWLRRWTSGPAEILGLQPPTLSYGQPADVTIFNPSTDWLVNPKGFQSRSANSPFTGITLTGKVIHTFFQGRKTF